MQAQNLHTGQTAQLIFVVEGLIRRSTFFFNIILVVEVCLSVCLSVKEVNLARMVCRLSKSKGVLMKKRGVCFRIMPQALCDEIELLLCGFILASPCLALPCLSLACQNLCLPQLFCIRELRMLTPTYLQ